MAVKEVLKYPNDILKQESIEVEELTDEKDELEYRYLEIVDILERDKKL